MVRSELLRPAASGKSPFSVVCKNATAKILWRIFRSMLYVYIYLEGEEFAVSSVDFEAITVVPLDINDKYLHTRNEERSPLPVSAKH